MDFDSDSDEDEDGNCLNDSGEEVDEDQYGIDNLEIVMISN